MNMKEARFQLLRTALVSQPYFSIRNETQETSNYIQSTYTTPVVRKEAPMLVPIINIHVVHSRRHDEHPNGEIDSV